MDNIDIVVHLNMLYDRYGPLLTEVQQAIFEDYYRYNLSLAEIAINRNISRAAVNDSLKKTVAKLEHFEEKLKIVDNYKQLTSLLEKARDEKMSKEELIMKLERLFTNGI